jgi:hypothetical protein
MNKTNWYGQHTLFIAITGMIFLSTASAQDIETLSQAQWNIPRSATTIIGMSAIQNTVRKYQASNGSRIHIRYAGGDEGTLWVNELRSWLVSLGVPSSDIELLPGASNPEQLELRVVNPLKSSRQATSIN